MKSKKQDLRIEAARQRESLPLSEVYSRSESIQEAAIRCGPYRAARKIALYSPLGNEVATGNILDHALKTGKWVYYPCLAEMQHPLLIRLESAADLRPGRYGILEPTGNRVLLTGCKDRLALFVPGLSFDTLGHRLGRGKGWYDRLFRSLGGGATLIALAYEFQVVDVVPVEAFDQRVDYIITETRIIDCQIGRRGQESGSDLILK